MKNVTVILATLVVMGLGLVTLKVSYAAQLDLFIPANGVSIAPEPRVEGQAVRLYAQAKTVEVTDTYGSITFYVEGTQIGSPQPISIINGVSDAVFMDWIPAFGGYIDISITANLNEDVDTNPDNNGQILSDIYIDYDTDGDGLGNQADLDDDNDGVLDEEDAFPLDNSESVDTDGDGIGNNADPDDDNDGISDEQEQNPDQSGQAGQTGQKNQAGQTSQTSQAGQTSQTSQAGQAGQAGQTSQTSQTSQTGQKPIGGAGGFVFPSEASGNAEPTPGNKNIEKSIKTNPLSADTDEDGVTDALDVFPANPAESADTDNDGLGNNTDLDDDNDELPDKIELRFGTNPLVPNTREEVKSIFDDLNKEVLGEKITKAGVEKKEESGVGLLESVSLTILGLAALGALMILYKKKR